MVHSLVRQEGVVHGALEVLWDVFLLRVDGFEASFEHIVLDVSLKTLFVICSVPPDSFPNQYLVELFGKRFFHYRALHGSDDEQMRITD